MADLPQAEIDHQLSRPTEYNCPGLNGFTITGIVIISIAVGLRFWSRRIARLGLKADDWTLLVAFILTLAAQSMSISNVYNAHSCYHALTMTKADANLQGKQWYAWNVLYTTSYPLARISLVLLYMRVFVKAWFRSACWFLIACFAGYSIGSMVADFCQVLPVEANWNPDVKATSRIDNTKLYYGNTGFNIATDIILLVMPLTVIWALKMTWLSKLALSGVFCLGGLTVVASIMRLKCYLNFTGVDPNYDLAPSQWWTIAEMDLGILCPCLVTLGPMIRAGYLIFSSNLSPCTRDRIDRITNLSSDPRTRQTKSDMEHSGSSTHVNGTASSRSHSLTSKPSDLEKGGASDAPPVPTTYTTDGLPRDKNGMAVSQTTAIANLDPRTQVKSSGQGQTKHMGTSAQAVGGDERSKDAPGQGIEVSRDWRLESEHGDH